MRQNEPPRCRGPHPQPRRPDFAVPNGATDCHAHVFGARQRYGFAADRLYTPPPVFAQDYIAMLDALGLARAVIVQSGVHGTNNSVIVNTIAQSRSRLRGIALIGEDISDAELDALAASERPGYRDTSPWNYKGCD